VGSIGLGIAIGTLAVDIVRKSWNPWGEGVVWITVGIPIGLLLFGAFMVYSAMTKQDPSGIQFFQNGMEIGEGSKRRFIPYFKLETFACYLADAKNAERDKMLLAARAAISAVALNPAGIGYAIGKAMQEPTYSELIIKPSDLPLFSIPLSRRDHDALAPVLAERVSA